MLIDVAVIVPVMNRPQNVDPLVESLLASTSKARMYFVVDYDDEQELEAVMRNEDCELIVNYSESKTFATKCNLGYRETDEPWLLFIGDDVMFHPGWREAALEAAGDRYSFVSTNDLGNRAVMLGLHATHPMIRRTWIDNHGASFDGASTVCHEGYTHWFVDNEWTMVAKRASQFVYAENAIIEHLHPLWNKGADDDVYRLGQRGSTADQQLWMRRKHRHA